MNDFSLLDELTDCARKNNLPVYRLSMYKGGDIRESEIIPAPDCCAIYSVSKNFITTACGMCIDDRRMTYDTTVWEMFAAEKPFMNPLWREVTLEIVLSQTVGCGGMFLDIDCQDAFSWGEDDWLDAVLKRPFLHRPGEVFDYSDANFYIASRMVAKASGMTASALLSRRLFERMKMQGWAWSCCPMGHAVGGSGLYLRCRDMAKLGALYMNYGIWDGERILSEEFCRRATSPISHPSDDTDYGLSFWLPKQKSGGKCSFRGSGMNNQTIWANRNSGYVIAWQAFDPQGKINGKFEAILNSR